jgi:hypothetical protein
MDDELKDLAKAALIELVAAHRRLGIRTKAVLTDTIDAGVEPTQAQWEAITLLTTKMEELDALIEASRAQFIQPQSKARH